MIIFFFWNMIIMVAGTQWRTRSCLHEFRKHNIFERLSNITINQKGISKWLLENKPKQIVCRWILSNNIIAMIILMMIAMITMTTEPASCLLGSSSFSPWLRAWSVVLNTSALAQCSPDHSVLYYDICIMTKTIQKWLTKRRAGRLCKYDRPR